MQFKVAPEIIVREVDEAPLEPQAFLANHQILHKLGLAARSPGAAADVNLAECGALLVVVPARGGQDAGALKEAG